MSETLLTTYASAVGALGYVAALMMVQLLVADVLGIRHKHTPGSTVPADHANILFRATRAVGNMNESIGIFICALLFCVLGSASPGLTANAAWGYAIARTLYLVCYYANLQIPRSICFGLSLLALAVMLYAGFFT